MLSDQNNLYWGDAHTNLRPHQADLFERSFQAARDVLDFWPVAYYAFCSEDCMSSFRRRYPTRIHRNCYETDCRDCNECVRRYDVDGFRRRLL